MFEPLFSSLTKPNLTQAVKFKILPSVTNYRHKKTSSKIAFGWQVIQNVQFILPLPKKEGDNGLFITLVPKV